MTKENWIEQLKQNLNTEGFKVTTEIVADYEEHFNAGLANGKTEAEIATKLGDPGLVARAHKAESLVSAKTEDGKSTDYTALLNGALRLLVLTPFNFIMLIGPFLMFAIMIVTGWSLIAGMAAGSVFGLLLILLSVPLMFIDFWFGGTALFGALGGIFLTVFGAITMYFITKWIFHLFASYLRWNANFILGKE